MKNCTHIASLGLISYLLLSLHGCFFESTRSPRDSVVPEWQKARQDEFLAFSCSHALSPGSMGSVLNHLTCEKELSDFTIAPGVIPDDAWDHTFEKLFRLRDTSDFDMIRILNLLYGFRGHPAASEVLWQKTENAVFNFKYWYTDKTPEREFEGEPVVDTMWYWTENHMLIFRVSEYLAGQKYPNKVFSVSGLTGKEHKRRAYDEIVRWIDERARWGFTEWHSDVYYNWDLKPLLALVDWSEDRELALRASMVLDLLWLDIALHLHRGNFGATHGRSYIKDKPAAPLQDVFGGAKLFFDDTNLPYTGSGGSNASAFARSNQYDLPWVVRTIARDDQTLIDRERMNLPIPEEPPASFDEPLAAPPYGIAYDDEKNLPFWWSMGGLVAWPLLPLTFEIAERENLWEAQFEPLSIVRDLIGPYEDEESFRKKVYPFYKAFWPVITEPLLEEVNTYTYRTKHYMLSAAQDYRPGMRSNQTQIWQATLNEKAVVFTTMPGAIPSTEGIDLSLPFDWQDFDEPGPGYWSGQGALPRVGVYKNVGVVIYAPQYEPKPLGLEDFDYRPETHAYFPVAHFDEVTRQANWIFGRADESFIALYSLNPTAWRSGLPEVFENDGQPFDLVAEGAQNIWLTELGDAESDGSFASFVTACLQAPVTWTAIPDQDADGFDDGYNVIYTSPSQGIVSFGWKASLVVAGEQIELKDYPRFDNPFVQTDFNDDLYDVSHGDNYLMLDFENGTREFSSPPIKEP